jgi:uncharacterized RDD family membrane protein YckC
METTFPPVGLLRRLAAIFYDSLLLFSVLYLAAALAYPLTQGKSSWIFQLYLLAVWFLYFAWPWLRGGQTLGMRAWRVKIQTTDGKRLSWQHVAIRFFTAFISWACLGIGLLWALVDKEKRAWHDLASHTQLVCLAVPETT